MTKEKNFSIALLALERLYLIFEKSSFFVKGVPRDFLNTCWEKILGDEDNHSIEVKKISAFIKSKKIPKENNCTGVDFYALSFISGIDCLISYLQTNDCEALNFICDELEMNLLDHYLFDTIFEDDAFVVNEEQENVVRKNPKMVKLHQAIDEEREILGKSNKIDAYSLDKLKKKFVFDII
jgi:hypothetical protein